MTRILSEVSILCKKIIPLILSDILRLYIINCHLVFKSAYCGFVSVVSSVMFPPPLTKDVKVLIPEPVNRLPYVEREISQMWWNEQSPSEKITLDYMDGFNVITVVLTRGSWEGQCQRSSCNDGRRGPLGERLRAGGEGDDGWWDGCMASPTQWTRVWVDSRSWWWTGKPGTLRFMGSQRVGHDCETELNLLHWQAGSLPSEPWCESFLKSLLNLLQHCFSLMF